LQHAREKSDDCVAPRTIDERGECPFQVRAARHPEARERCARRDSIETVGECLDERRAIAALAEHVYGERAFFVGTAPERFDEDRVRTGGAAAHQGA
jgi:hypothetical protein